MNGRMHKGLQQQDCGDRKGAAKSMRVGLIDDARLEKQSREEVLVAHTVVEGYMPVSCMVQESVTG